MSRFGKVLAKSPLFLYNRNMTIIIGLFMVASFMYGAIDYEPIMPPRDQAVDMSDYTPAHKVLTKPQKYATIPE